MYIFVFDRLTNHKLAAIRHLFCLSHEHNSKGENECMYREMIKQQFACPNGGQTLYAHFVSQFSAKSWRSLPRSVLQVVGFWLVSWWVGS